MAQSRNDGSDLELPELAPADTKQIELGLTNGTEAGNLKCVGEMRLRLLSDGTFDIQFPVLGLLTIGRLESATNQMYTALMRARAAHLRKSQGQPEHFNLHPSDVA
jgi:hypothetical protein